jgi:uncharacterized membrane protein YhaH (DUF805 family)
MPWLREFSTRGRLGRAGFWLRQAVSVPLGLWLCIAVRDSFGPPFDLIAVLALVLHLISTWGRRLHDRDRSAWWLLATLVPLAGALWLWIECGFRAGSVGANRHGRSGSMAPDYLRVTSSTVDPSSA